MSIHPSLLHDLIDALDDVEPLNADDLPDTRLNLDWIEPLLPTKKEKDN